MNNTTSPAQNDETQNADQDESLAIAREILRQLGGRMFLMMTGSKQLLALKSGLQFTVGENENGVNRIQVILDADDTYTVKASQVRVNRRTGVVKEEPKGEEEGVYNDSLQAVFTRLTGLYTRL